MEKTFDVSRDDNAYSVIETGKNNYSICGKTFSFGAGEFDVYLMRADIDENIVWEKTFGGELKDIGRLVFETGNGDYIILRCIFRCK